MESRRVDGVPRYERARPAPSRSDRGGPNSAGNYPPLYYLYADIGYFIDQGGTAFGRLYTMRLWAVLLLALNALAGWLLAGEILGPRRLPQLACGAIAGLLPMETFMGASVNPDALMVPLWTFALWLGARIIVRRAPIRDVVAICAVAAAAVLTKAPRTPSCPRWFSLSSPAASGGRRNSARARCVKLPLLVWSFSFLFSGGSGWPRRRDAARSIRWEPGRGQLRSR